MKILFDPQVYYYQKFGGISRYYTEIFSLISKRQGIEAVLPVCYTENEYALEHHLLNENAIMRFLFKAASIMNISTRTLQKKRAARLLTKTVSEFSFDLFIPTFFDPYFLKFTGSKPFVLTVYDMIHELFPEYYTGESLTIVQDKLELMEKATMIIAVSHNTKKDILSIYPHLDASKIEVIYHGSSIKHDTRVQVKLPSNYILFVGERANYKNFRFLLQAVVPLLQTDPSLILLCAGGGAFKKEETDEFIKLGVQQQVMQQSFQEQQLSHFYANAKCFVFPSLYEGFGIPVLEAMACGCPVVLGHHSSFPEVAGEAGVYADITSADELRAKIHQLLANQELRNRYSQKGLARAAMFSWEDAAEQCLNAYKTAVERSAMKNRL
jgi:glycosyltransferase involved in cell wall biosynthesis